MKCFTFSFGLVLVLCAASVFAAEIPAVIPLDERPAAPGEWGDRPTNGEISPVSPPAFTWRPTPKIVRWEIVVDTLPADSKTTKTATFQCDNIGMTTYTPDKPFPPGMYVWQYRGFDAQNNATNWSQPRIFKIDAESRPMPMPNRETLLAKIPTSHPRIFVRPDTMPKLQQLAQNELKKEYDELLRQCDTLIQSPPRTVEPPLYKDKNNWKNELGTWWGNRTKTIAVLENAALLAFVWNLSGDEKYAQLAKKLLMATAEWDPKGATGYRYNDEAGMPYNYHFSRTYTFLNGYLTDAERAQCREVMAIRGKEMYDHLHPSHLWRPYGSHQNRAWHFLGEVGIAFYGEIPEAENWVWFAMNVFYAMYPVWSDSDGGWHEGISYWNSYQQRFCWMADVMKAAFGINAFDKPYYSQVGFYPMYLTPPGRIGGGFADLCNTTPSSASVNLMRILALQSGNPYWNWFVKEHQTRGSSEPTDYYTLIRKANALQENRGATAPKSPKDLPVSRLFRGIGQAYMNTTLLDAKDNVQVLFKSSPFGTQSHGYDANNSFYFSAWNENLLINTGRRDYYGSPHHTQWMWSTRSENNILVDGVGQYRRDARALGEIVHFETTNDYDVVVGEAATSYEKDVLKRYTRTIVFLKPDVMLVYDQLEAKEPATFDYWLHAQKPFQPLQRYFPGALSKENDAVFASIWKDVKLESPEAMERVHPIVDQHDIAIRVDKVACRLNLLLPEGLTFEQTNQYDPTPQSKISVREWHLTAKTPEKATKMEFLLYAQPWKVAEHATVPPVRIALAQSGDGTRRVVVVLPSGKLAHIRFFAEPKKYPQVSMSG